MITEGSVLAVAWARESPQIPGCGWPVGSNRALMESTFLGWEFCASLTRPRSPDEDCVRLFSASEHLLNHLPVCAALPRASPVNTLPRPWPIKANCRVVRRLLVYAAFEFALCQASGSKATLCFLASRQEQWFILCPVPFLWQWLSCRDVPRLDLLSFSPRALSTGFLPTSNCPTGHPTACAYEAVGDSFSKRRREAPNGICN